jgi:hypothetical protein
MLEVINAWRSIEYVGFAKKVKEVLYLESSDNRIWKFWRESNCLYIFSPTKIETCIGEDRIKIIDIAKLNI